MSVSINTNLSSMRAQRQLSVTSQKLQGTFQRLSSGLRIAKASDDAAGLAIASSLKTDARVYVQGLRNINDGISMINIAESATGELSNILSRLEELAEAAANGTLTLTQRSALDAEADALVSEHNRITATVEFNGGALFSGSYSSTSIQAGYGDNGSITIGIGSSLRAAVGSGSLQAAVSYSSGVDPYGVASGDFNNDGNLDLVAVGSGQNADILLGNGDGTFKARLQNVAGLNPDGVRTTDFNGDGILDIAVSSTGASRVDVLIGNGNGTFKAATVLSSTGNGYFLDVADVNGDNKADIVKASTSTGYAEVFIGAGDGTFQSPRSFYAGAATSVVGVALGDVNGDGNIDLTTSERGAADKFSVMLGNGDGSFRARVSYQISDEPSWISLRDINDDGRLDAVTASYNGGVDVLIGNGDGSFQARVNLNAGANSDMTVLQDMNGDGHVDIVATSLGDQRISIFLNNGNGTFLARTSQVASGTPDAISVGDFNGDGVNDVAMASASADSVNILSAQLSYSAITPYLNLKTQDEALNALTLLRGRRKIISQELGNLGALVSRLNSAAATLSQTHESYESASSQILDADVADESATLVRLQILQNSAAAILQQANQTPALALRLLQS